MNRPLLLFLLACALPIDVCRAWGKLGHQTVANVAWDLLDESTRHQIQQVLDGSAEPQVHSICAEPCSPLAFVADWADDARYSRYWHWTGGLHYVDIQDDSMPSECMNDQTGNHDLMVECRFQHARDCQDDFCVSGAILNYTQQLMTADQQKNPDNEYHDYDAEERKIALMFVTHFIGDIHQPLHVSKTSDRGGNTLKVHLKNWTVLNSEQSTQRHRNRRELTAYPGRLRGHHHDLNLHAVWDDSLIETFIINKGAAPSNDEMIFTSRKAVENRTILEEAVHKQIEHARISGSMWSSWLACPLGHEAACPDAWAQESWILAKGFAYIHVNGTQIQSDDILGPDYYHRNMPIILDQLAMGAVRLAATLQAVFAIGNGMGV